MTFSWWIDKPLSQKVCCHNTIDPITEQMQGGVDKSYLQIKVLINV